MEVRAAELTVIRECNEEIGQRAKDADIRSSVVVGGVVLLVLVGWYICKRQRKKGEQKGKIDAVMRSRGV